MSWLACPYLQRAFCLGYVRKEARWGPESTRLPLLSLFWSYSQKNLIQEGAPGSWHLDLFNSHIAKSVCLPQVLTIRCTLGIRFSDPNSQVCGSLTCGIVACGEGGLSFPPVPASQSEMAPGSSCLPWGTFELCTFRQIAVFLFHMGKTNEGRPSAPSISCLLAFLD